MTVEPTPARIEETLWTSAERAPARTAIVDRTSLDHGTLAAAAAGFVRELRDDGVEPGDRVAAV